MKKFRIGSGLKNFYIRTPLRRTLLWVARFLEKSKSAQSLRISVLAAEKLATSSSNLGKHGDWAPEKKNDSSNVSFIKNCDDSASWPKHLSTTQRDFQSWKIHIPKVDLNFVFPKYGVDWKFTNCCLQRKLSFYLMDRSCKCNGFVSLINKIGTKAAKLPKDFDIQQCCWLVFRKKNTKKFLTFYLSEHRRL